ncbi:MAG: hypothetical protein E7165_03040 [Firmicutes bacterium]|nr:hypothetical protein [Bacillota bacterium]
MSKAEFKNIDHFKKISNEFRGTNEKEWLLSPNQLLCLYKITQIKDNNTSTNAHYAESLYSEICKLLHINCCKIELVKSRKGIGIISYCFLQNNEELIDFNALIQNIRQDFVPKSLKCKKTKEYYSIQLILEAIKAVIPNRDEYKQITKQLFTLIIMDALCDHYDRNASNLALIRNHDNPHHPYFKFAGAYDNGTSLWVSLPIDIAKNYLNDPNGIEKLDSCIVSKIGISIERGTTYSELLSYLFSFHHEECKEFIETLDCILTEKVLIDIIFQKKYKGLDNVYKKLILIKLIYNKEKIISLYKHYSNSNIKIKTKK